MIAMVGEIAIARMEHGLLQEGYLIGLSSVLAVVAAYVINEIYGEVWIDRLGYAWGEILQGVRLLL